MSHIHRDEKIAASVGVDTADYNNLDPIAQQIVHAAYDIATAERQIHAALQSILRDAARAQKQISDAWETGERYSRLDRLGSDTERYATTTAQLEQLWSAFYVLVELRKATVAAVPQPVKD
jgi:hypothetical protein